MLYGSDWSNIRMKMFINFQTISIKVKDLRMISGRKVLIFILDYFHYFITLKIN